MVKWHLKEDLDIGPRSDLCLGTGGTRTVSICLQADMHVPWMVEQNLLGSDCAATAAAIRKVRIELTPNPA